VSCHARTALSHAAILESGQNRSIVRKLALYRWKSESSDLAVHISAGKIAHDLTNKMQCVSGYLDLGEYAKAEKSTADAINLLRRLCRLLELTEDRLGIVTPYADRIEIVAKRFTRGIPVM
jgi:hypothetical protein